MAARKWGNALPDNPGANRGVKALENLLVSKGVATRAEIAAARAAVGASDSEAAKPLNLSTKK